MIEVFNLTPKDIVTIKNGNNFIDETGKEIANAILTNEPAKAKSYAFCSDTIYDPSIVEQIKQVDLLYHESTFLDDKKQRAKETFHSTAKEAAEIAKQAQVGKLLLGHFSARYKELDEFKTQASEIFFNSALALEGLTFKM